MKKGRTEKAGAGSSSIKVKLICVIIPSVIAAIAIIMMMAYNYSEKSIISKTEALIISEAETGIHEILAWEEENLTILETMTDAMTDLNLSTQRILSYLRCSLDRYEDFPNGVYITYSSGQVLDGSDWVPEGNATEGVWYVEGVTHDTFLFGEAYLDSFTREYVVTASKFLPSFNGSLDAVAAADISLSKVSGIVEEMEIADVGDAFMIDASTGMILAHKEEAFIGTLAAEAEDVFYREVMADIEAGNLNKTSYESADGTYIACILPVEKTNWYMVARVSRDRMLEDLYRLRLYMVLMAAAAILIMSVLIERVVNAAIRPIKALTSTIITITDGDFTEEITVKGRDEVAIMAAHMQEFLVIMRGMIRSLITISENLIEKAKGSNALSEELQRSAGSQSESMNQMNVTVEEMARAITEIAENATSLAMIVADTNQDSVMVTESMKDTKDAADQGRTDMGHVNSAMGNIEVSMETLGQSIEEVGKSAVKINEITHTIREIADETNLLSLNASIEAARAGETGKGFAVVANQIKHLAETSASAADEISQLIMSISSLIGDTVDKSQNSMKEIKESAQLVDVATEKFNQIYKSINDTNEVIGDMVDKVKQVDDVATSLAAITEEQSASAEEIESAAAELDGLAQVVADNSKDVAEDARELTSLSLQLKEQIAKFKI